MNDKERQALEHIISYCQKAETAQRRFFASREAFDEEDFYRDGCAFYVQQIGEWVKELSEEFMHTNSQIAWRNIRGIRNIIAHAYEKVDPNVMWEIISEDLPQLKNACETLLRE